MDFLFDAKGCFGVDNFPLVDILRCLWIDWRILFCVTLGYEIYLKGRAGKRVPSSGDSTAIEEPKPGETVQTDEVAAGKTEAA